jgi:CBS domain-containing protein
MKNEIIEFLSNISLFSSIPTEEIEKLYNKITIEEYKKGTHLFYQGKSEIKNLYIIKEGEIELYFEKEGKKEIIGYLSKGEAVGGIAILMNSGITVRNILIKKDALFYIIPKQIFLELCGRFEAFYEYFTKTYSSLIPKNMEYQEESLDFFNHKIENICNKDLIYCYEADPIKHAASVMKRFNISSLLIRNIKGEFIGIVTDSDLRNKVVADGYNIERPVFEIMSAPLITMPENALIFEAIIEIMRKNKRHLAVSDIDGDIIGIITHRDILSAQGQTPCLFIREISSAQTLEKIIEKNSQIPKIIHGLIGKGAKSENITRFITTISDAVLNKLVEFAIDDLGAPPAKFVFMVMGSEGRQEQTLKTDQDNAIIFEDAKGSEKEVMDYFLKLGEKVCNWLDKAGYKFCKGNIMAKNPKLCQPISIWKKYFNAWIYEAQPEDLLNASIFFDFRKGYGDDVLIDELRAFLFDSLKNWSGFFRRLTENALYFKPPIGLFRNFIVETKGKHKNSFDIKRAMMPVVDFARIYALKHSLKETNTHERLDKLYAKKVLSNKDYKDIDQSYKFMMQLRFVRQVRAIVYEKKEADNYINPNNLSRLEQKMLKEIFKKIEKFQEDSGLTFMGI